MNDIDGAKLIAGKGKTADIIANGARMRRKQQTQCTATGH
jgi:hypothetical protein